MIQDVKRDCGLVGPCIDMWTTRSSMFISRNRCISYLFQSDYWSQDKIFAGPAETWRLQHTNTSMSKLPLRAGHFLAYTLCIVNVEIHRLTLSRRGAPRWWPAALHIGEKVLNTTELWLAGHTDVFITGCCQHISLGALSASGPISTGEGELKRALIWQSYIWKLNFLGHH